MMHGAGWMEGGLQASFEKMVIDADMLHMASAALDPLVVDDDSAVRLVLTKLLRQVGYDARSVASGPEALRAIDARAIDLVVTDLAMPTMSGIQLAAELVERCPGLPVIVLTAHGNVPTAVEAMRAGARDFLMKPFDRDQVCRVVEAALGRGGRGG